MNACILSRLEILEEEILELREKDQLLFNLIPTININSNRRERRLAHRLNKIQGLTISVAKAVSRGFVQINKGQPIDQVEIEKLENAFKNLQIC